MLGAVAIGALTPTIVSYARRAAVRRALRPIGAVKEGELVTILGRVHARTPLRMSPIMRRRCIGYRLVVAYYDAGGVGWQPTIEETAFDSFVLADSTGEALLHPPFDIKLEPDTRTEGAPAPQALSEWLEREGVRPHGVSGEPRIFECVETVLLPGDQVIAVGHATIGFDPGGRSPSHREPPIICHLRGGDEKVVIAEPDGIS